MNDEYFGFDEISSILELIIVIAFMCVGLVGVQWHVRYLQSKTILTDNYDKVAANIEYEEVADKVYVFTPYQAYMIGYYMDNWGPDNMNSITYINHSNVTHNVTISPTTYGSNLVMRNNMISGANYDGNSVRSVLDHVRNNLNMEGFWRGQYTLLYLSLTDAHSSMEEIKGDDGVTVINRRKNFVWIMDQEPHRLEQEGYAP